MTLSDKQLEARRGRLTASRVAPLMNGDAAALHQLWLEMTGQAEREDLSHVWAVQRGLATEQLNLDWYAYKQNVPVTRRGEVVVHPRHDCFAATLDGWDARRNHPVECKDCSGFESMDDIVARYRPQCYFQMACTNSAQYALSVILAGAEPVVRHFDMAFDYATDLTHRALWFMDCVRERVPPGPVSAVAAPPDKWRDYDMRLHESAEEWRRYAEVYLQTIGATETCRDAAASLKGMVPDDARKAYGAGVIVKRDRGGRLSLRIDV